MDGVDAPACQAARLGPPADAAPGNAERARPREVATPEEIRAVFIEMLHEALAAA